MTLSLALPSTEGRVYQNPLGIFLNEALSYYQDGVSQFIEMVRHFFRDDATLQGYSVIVAESSGPNEDLYIKCAFNLESSSFKNGQQYGTIGRSTNEIDANDLMPWTPHYKTLRVTAPGMTTSYDFLSVPDFQVEIIFLLYHENLTVFDQEVWPKRQQGGRKMFLRGKLYDYVQQNTIDSIVIGGLGAPDIADEVRKIFCKMFDIDQFIPFSFPYSPGCNSVESTTTSVSVGFPLSINRCGLQDLPFMFHSYKHGSRKI